ncbi:tRNA pseudouridine(55) synthase TruB [Abyssibacter profundi]|uniref:tRNA pseudouridine synthase B n=1 Tax=Abyssibacter profundi TaxID=2182787 RepID=A0A363UMY9_9GAMM|nr:tRNA pseudouridine(55) synthase TruB [Abyssibacter profundi]PWN56781.1 tRNA pseudouridine(55) synthase TruB [Abyssibacter profundi]
MARKRRGRPVSGILLLDKPAGASSNGVLQRVRWLFKAQKAGHTGSLDPLATGMLPICFGEATKLSGYLLDADKRYTVTAQLGTATTTGDAEGEVAEHGGLDPRSFVAAAQDFVGEIEQVPPMYSAVKHQGRRLYELARAGETVERKRRRISIHAIELIDQTAESVTLSVSCSKGTYIRTLVEDIAKAAGGCAHVAALHRTQAGPFEGAMVTMDQIESLSDDVAALDQLLLPATTAVADWPTVHVNADSAYFLRRGQAVQVPKAPTEGLVAMLGPGNDLIGIGEILDDGRVGPRRVMASQPAGDTPS